MHQEGFAVYLPSASAPTAWNFIKVFTRADGFIIQELYVLYILCLSSSKRGAVKEPVARKVDIEDIQYIRSCSAHHAEPGEGWRPTVQPPSRTPTQCSSLPKRLRTDHWRLGAHFHQKWKGTKFEPLSNYEFSILAATSTRPSVVCLLKSGRGVWNWIWRTT